MEQFICNNCGHIGKPSEKLRGNFPLEFILWWFMIIPGIVYSYWRRSDKIKTCVSCHKESLISANSPIGQKLLNDTNQQVVQEEAFEKKSVVPLILLIALLFGLLFSLAVLFI